MMKTYTETFTLRTRDCDLKGTWRLSAVLEAMQEAAGTHSMLLGCGRDELLKKNIVWVLSRSELHMDRYPEAGEKDHAAHLPDAEPDLFLSAVLYLHGRAGRNDR